MSRFHYVIERVRTAKIITSPFPHLYIQNIFNDSDFKCITSDCQININVSDSDLALLDLLSESGYRCTPFPGCTIKSQDYLRWHKTKRIDHCDNFNTCEGFGITYKLHEPHSEIVRDLVNLFDSSEFYCACADHFAIDIGKTYKKSGLHKYLDGYEISPHPDVRKKALTYMVNINPSNFSEKLSYHTHLMTFKDEYKYIQAYWEGNPLSDRCWLPWEWCNTEFVHSVNNSIVVFSPSNATLHAVKAHYNHLLSQRTQLYGNLWYHNIEVDSKPAWEDFIVTPSPMKRHVKHDY